MTIPQLLTIINENTQGPRYWPDIHTAIEQFASTVWDAGYNRGLDQQNVLKPEGNMYPDKETFINQIISKV